MENNFKQIFKRDQIYDKEYEEQMEAISNASGQLEMLSSEMDDIYRKPQELLDDDQMKLDEIFDKSKESFNAIVEDVDGLIDSLKHMPIKVSVVVVRMTLNIQIRVSGNLTERLTDKRKNWTSSALA